MPNYKKIKGLIELLRPELPFAAGISVIIGEIITLGKLPSLSELFLGFMWGFLLSGSAMILNDFFDIEVDKINAPNRPLPSGLVSSNTAIVFTIIISLLGLVISFFINKAAILLYIIFWFIGFLYNWKLKEKGLLGNLFVSSSVAVTIILGAIAVGNPWNEAVLIFSLMLFVFDLGEEIAADAMDIEGDKKRNIKSIAILIGRQKALNISFLLFMIYIILSFIPVILNLFGISYLIIISLTNSMILIWGIKLIKSSTIKEGRIYVRRLYLSGLLGFLLIIISMIVI
ncbi:(S)-2,3-di-O-geranylgeranylglyceryl phosphate synthase [Halanaerobium saccharolyticum subsp. saccharolyticum DSM 6643]|uniref:(S)-2,3-di-O-geranylgeranylglyceryl phosphate synthase n=1 Tax=Halanaerobium saccharolyticum subsp. saccharolyticum DSM 6643 TaxID=1293054 RepID=M5E0D1_9FIRM|nr:UbiA family prenyltransferase [Halanaerobium saccharolyticum]CCU79094.1 (S)-2,3-di-O-geranylgeranylglyceryl phosphate synthase [Halanaerobium saccharolyticum subsp. saccharolyticum DSM 6643]